MKRKCLAIGIILLFVGTCIIPTTAQNISIDVSDENRLLPSRAENWAEIQKLTSSGEGRTYFGESVSICGNTALIGQLLSEKVYVFTQFNNTWMQQAILLPSDGPLDGHFGWSVSLFGDTALIGASIDEDGKGSAYVFTRTGSNWTQQAKLLAIDNQSNDYFGGSVSLSGDTALIGAIGYGDTGAAYVFTRTGSNWTQQAKLLASDGGAGDWFGYSVSLSGDTALIGAVQDDDCKGAAYIFTRTGTTWAQQAKLIASDGTEGRQFGCSVSLDNNTTLIGAKYDRVCCGSAYIFTRSDDIWTQQAKLIASDGEGNDNFGYSVSLDGSTALIGAVGDGDNGYQSGSAYVFTRTGSTWLLQIKLLALDGSQNDVFGNSVSLSGDIALIGASGAEGESGAVYVFKNFGETSDIKFNFKGGFGVTLWITNYGQVNYTNVPWEISVKGAIFGLINRKMSGTINIAVGETIPVGPLRLFNFAPIKITGKVGNLSKTVTGEIIIILVKIIA